MILHSMLISDFYFYWNSKIPSLKLMKAFHWSFILKGTVKMEFFTLARFPIQHATALTSIFRAFSESSKLVSEYFFKFTCIHGIPAKSRVNWTTNRRYHEKYSILFIELLSKSMSEFWIASIFIIIVIWTNGKSSITIKLLFSNRLFAITLIRTLYAFVLQVE